MTVIEFPNCNYKVLRDTTWSMPIGFIADETRAGTRKVRGANTAQPNSFSVKLRFETLNDYETFDFWYNYTSRKGLFAFKFRNLKKHASSGSERIYRFSADGTPQVNNVGGEVVDVSMIWEEV